MPSFSATVPCVSNHTRHGEVPSGAAPTMPSPVTPNAFATRSRYAASTAGRVTAKDVASHGCPGRTSTSSEICTRSKNGFGCSAGRCGISLVNEASGEAVPLGVGATFATDVADAPTGGSVGPPACDEQPKMTKTSAIAGRRSIGRMIRP